ncbi:MAG: hypothetical protein WCD42_03845 [Rhizomicrobium sp.]
MTGLARLLAKAWIIFCLYAGGLASGWYWSAGGDLVRFGAVIALPVVLFAALGLVFAAGYLVLARHGAPHRPFVFIVGFNEAVFVAFTLISFINQVFFAPWHLDGTLSAALERALYSAIPGQRALVAMLRPCMIDGGRIFTSGITWCLAIIYLGSALSRLKITATIIRLSDDAGGMGSVAVAILLGLISLAGIYALYIGGIYALFSCSFLAGIGGGLLIGLAPLMLAYAIAMAWAAAMAGSKK